MRALVAFLAILTSASVWAQAAANPPAAQTGAALTAEARAAAAPRTAPLTSIPRGRGLPVVVRTGVYYADVKEVDENKGTYVATLDVRMRWGDPRLSYEAVTAPRGFQEFRGADADAKLATIWYPDIGVNNVVDKPASQSQSLRVYPDGRVELMQRLTAKLTTTFNVESFPFDRQRLDVLVGSRRETSERVTLDFQESELEFSRVVAGVDLDGWTTGLVDVRRAPQPGWYGETYSQINAALEIKRQPGGPVAGIFIPLLASLLIPMLAIWLNRVEDGDFVIETFELSNIIIGGLFAVIALNFTVNAAYESLGASENPVSRLFALNYITLGVSLLVNILLFRFQVVKALFGKYVQEQLYKFLVWAIPACVLVSVVAVLSAAMVG